MTKLSFSTLIKVNSFFTRLVRGIISGDKCAKQPRMLGYHFYQSFSLCKYYSLLSTLYRDPGFCIIFLYVIPLGKIADVEMKDTVSLLLKPPSAFGIFQSCIPHGMKWSPLPRALSDFIDIIEVEINPSIFETIIQRNGRNNIGKRQIFSFLKLVVKIFF